MANFSMAAFMIMLTFIFPIVLAFSGYNHWNLVFSCYGGILLSVLCYLAVGIFASSLTENLVISALLSFCLLLGIMLFSLTGNATDNQILSQIFQYFAVPFHFESFIRGGIRSFNFVYLFSFIGFFAYLTGISLDSRKW
jgi:ABC-2 type transport system permease protein